MHPSTRVFPRNPPLLLCVSIAAALAVFSGVERPRATDSTPSNDVGELSALIDSLLYRGGADSAAVLIAQGLEQARATNDSVLLGRMLSREAGLQDLGGDFEQALELYEWSSVIAQAVGDTSTWMRGLGGKGNNLEKRGEFDRARAAFEERLRLADLTRDHASRSKAHLDLGDLALTQRRLPEAMTHLRLAEEGFRGVHDVQYVASLNRIGIVFLYMGEADSSRVMFERTLEEARRTNQPPQVAEAYQALGVVEWRSGDMGKAARYFRRCYEYHRDAGHTRYVMRPASNLSETLIYLGSYDEAATLLEEAIQVCIENGYDRDRGFLLTNLARVRLAQGRWGGAAAACRQSLSLESTITTQARSSAVLTLATALIAQDSTDAAIAELRAELDGDPHPVQEPALATALAACLRESGHTQEALAAAMRAERTSVDPADHKDRVAAVFELSRCRAAAGDIGGAWMAFASGLELAEGVRGQQAGFEWREALGASRVLVDASDVVLQRRNGMTYDEKVEELYSILQRFKARTLLERITEPREAESPTTSFAGLGTVSLDRLQKQVLKPGELLLDFVVGQRTTYLFAVTVEGRRMTRLPGHDSELRSQVSLFVQALGDPDALERARASVEDARGSVEDARESVESAAAGALGDAVLGELADWIERASHVIVAPDGFFNALPYGALRLGEDGDPLLVKRRFSRVPSVAVLQVLRESKSDSVTMAPPILALKGGDSDELAGVRREMDFLEREFESVQMIDGPRDSVRAAVLAGGQVIHIAGHVRVNDERPWYSGILLAGKVGSESGGSDSRRGDGEGVIEADPYLRARDIAGAKIESRLAVLSGCESAMGRVTRGEGVLGLTSAFLSAGVSAVVGALWEVDDGATAGLMERFYHHLAQGDGAAQALQAAQLETRAQEATAAPHYWAGFVLVGEDAITVDLPRRRPMGTWLLAIAGLALLAGVALVRVRSTRASTTRELLSR